MSRTGLEPVTLSFAFRPLLFGTQPANFLFRYDGEAAGDTMALSVTVEQANGETTRGDKPTVFTRK